MPNRTSNRRADDQLAAIFGETGSWMVHGSDGRVLAVAASLGHAVEKAVEFETANQRVVAVARQPSEDIVVFSGQNAAFGQKSRSPHRAKCR